MKRTMRLGTAFLCGSMMLSFALGSTGCSAFDKSNKQISEVSESFCKALCDQKTKAAAKLVNDDDAEDAFDYYFDYDSSENAEVYDAISKTISYELDEDSIEADKKHAEGSVDVIFTIADYESIFEDGEFINAEEFADAIADSKETKDIELVLELEYMKDDSTWAVDNYEEILDEVFGFTEYEPEYVKDLLSSLEDWFILTSDFDDRNVTYIDFDAYFTDDFRDMHLSGYCDLYLSGTLIATRYFDVYDFIFVTFEASDCSIVTEDGCFPAGNYEVQAYLSDGTFIASDCVTVFHDLPTPTPTPTPTPEPVTSPDEVNELSVGYAALVFMEEGAMFEDCAEELGVTSASGALVSPGGMVYTDFQIPDTGASLNYSVHSTENHEFYMGAYYVEDPEVELGDRDNYEIVDVSCEVFEQDDGTFVTNGYIENPQPGIYMIYVFCDEVEGTGDSGNLVVADFIWCF